MKKPFRWLTKEEIWATDYAIRPYLADTPDKDLVQRFHDLANNILRLNEVGQISILPPGPEGFYWGCLIQHVLEEYKRREWSIPEDRLGQLIAEKIPVPSHPIAPRGLRILNGQQLPSGRHLLKVNKLRWMKQMLETGKIRIFPASDYKDPSLNHAIQDDELSLISYLLRSEVTVSFIDRETGREETPIKPLSDIRRTVSSSTDYYVYCMCYRYDWRLLDDLNYDSFVLITDVDKFTNRILSTFKRVMPEYVGWAAGVTYLDPYNSDPNWTDIFACKHFRYAYQKEYRFIWLPPKPIQKLEYVDIELGSLHDIAQLFSLA